MLLSEPLAGTVDDKLLVRTGATGGDETYLVVRYEYTPGFEEIDALSGRRTGALLAQRLRQVGLTANDNSDTDD